MQQESINYQLKHHTVVNVEGSTAWRRERDCSERWNLGYLVG